MRLSALLAFGSLCLMAQDPVDYNGWLNQGVQLFKQAHYLDAVASFERAVALDPSKTAGRLYLATAYMQQYIPGAQSPENEFNAQRASDQFRQVLNVEPQNKIALGSLASLALNQKKFDDALGWYEKLIAVDPNNANAYYSLGFVAWSKWYPAYAKARKDLGMRPEAPGPLIDPAVRQSLNAQYGPLLQAGIDAMNRALEINPQFDDAMAYINLLIRERADLRDTVSECRQDVATADEWVQKALETKKAKAHSGQVAVNRDFSGLVAAPPPPPPPPPPPGAPAVPERIKVAGNVVAPRIIKRVEPVNSGIRGEVVLGVVIGKAGDVLDLRVKQGDPALIKASLDAVKQWKYQPTLLNGQPVEVETEVALVF